MIRGLARSAFAPLLSEAASSLRGVADAAEDRAMRGTVRMASVLAIAIGAALAGVLAMTFLALALRRGLAAAYDPVAADIALAIGFMVLALALVLVLRAKTRPSAGMRRPPFRYDGASSFASRSGSRTTNRSGAHGGSPGRGRSSRPYRSEPNDRRTVRDDPAADADTPDDDPAGPPAVAVAGVMVAAVVAGLLLGRRS